MDTENVVNEENTEVVDELEVENNDEVVNEESTEVEVQETPEIEPVKTFTQDEVNAMIKTRVDRQARKHKRELDQYRKLETYSQTLYGADSLEETLAKLEETYELNEKEIPVFESFQADRDTRILAQADAQEIIEAGEEEVALAYNEFRQIPESRKTKRDRVMEDILYENLQGIKQARDFVRLGGDREILNDSEFLKFKSKFAKDTDLYDIYKMYQTLNAGPEEETKPVKSLKSSQAEEKRDYISKEEYMKLTEADFEREPDLLRIIERSMDKW